MTWKPRPRGGIPPYPLRPAPPVACQLLLTGGATFPEFRLSLARIDTFPPPCDLDGAPIPQLNPVKKAAWRGERRCRMTTLDTPARPDLDKLRELLAHREHEIAVLRRRLDQ